MVYISEESLHGVGLEGKYFEVGFSSYLEVGVGGCWTHMLKTCE